MRKVKASPRKRVSDRTEKVASDNTGPKVDTRFKSGAEWRGNAKGRPKGSRNKLNAKFIDDLHGLWMEQGEDILRRTSKHRPQDIVKAQVALMPREMKIEKAVEQLSDTDLADLSAALLASIRVDAGAEEGAAGSVSERAGPKGVPD